MGTLRETIAVKATTGSLFLWREAASRAGLSLASWIRQVADAAAGAATSTRSETPSQEKSE